MFYDLEEALAKQYIDATQARSAYLDAERQAGKYRGSMFWRTAKGRDYLIKETDRIEKSLGARTPESEAIFNEFRRKKAETEDRKRSLSDVLVQQQRVNAALRIGRTPNVVVGLLNALRTAGIDDHFMVIGTNALYAYETHAGVRFTGDITATTDIDFLWDSRKHLALVSNDPDFNEQGLIGILKKVDPTFAVHDDESYRASNSKGYMVDLIKRGAASYFDDHEKAQVRPVEDDFWAAKIKNMDWLLSSPKFKQPVVAVNGSMAEMVTVDPRAFVLYKLHLAQKEDRDPVKKPRDVTQAQAVFELIQQRLPHLGFDRIHVFPERVRNMLDTLSSGSQSLREEPSEILASVPPSLPPEVLLERLKGTLAMLSDRLIQWSDTPFQQLSGTVLAANDRWAAMHTGKAVQILDREKWPVEEGCKYILSDKGDEPGMKRQAVDFNTAAALVYAYGPKMGDLAREWAERDKALVPTKGKDTGLGL